MFEAEINQFCFSWKAPDDEWLEYGLLIARDYAFPPMNSLYNIMILIIMIDECVQSKAFIRILGPKMGGVKI